MTSVMLNLQECQHRNESVIIAIDLEFVVVVCVVIGGCANALLLRDVLQNALNVAENEFPNDVRRVLGHHILPRFLPLRDSFLQDNSNRNPVLGLSKGLHKDSYNMWIAHLWMVLHVDEKLLQVIDRRIRPLVASERAFRDLKCHTTEVHTTTSQRSQPSIYPNPTIIQ